MRWRVSAFGSVRRSCGSQSGNGNGSGTRCWSSSKACRARGRERKVGRWSLAKGSSWMVGNWWESKGGSQRVGPEGCPPMDRGSDCHGPHPALARRGRAGNLDAGSWSQAPSWSRSHPLSLQGTERLQPCLFWRLVVSPDHPDYGVLVRGGQSAC